MVRVVFFLFSGLAKMDTRWYFIYKPFKCVLSRFMLHMGNNQPHSQKRLLA